LIVTSPLQDRIQEELQMFHVNKNTVNKLNNNSTRKGTKEEVKKLAMKKESHTKKLAIKTTFSIGLYLFFLRQHHKVSKKVAHHKKKS
jgi:hypothetical protein